MKSPPAKPTSKSFTFSIRDVLVMTTVVALWLLMFQMDNTFALMAAGPVTYAACVLSIGKPQWLIWFPAFTFICMMTTDLLLVQFKAPGYALFIMSVATTASIVERTLRKCRGRFEEGFSFGAILETTWIEASAAGAAIGLTFAMAWSVIAVIACFFDPAFSVEFVAIALVVLAGFPVVIGLFGLLLGFPLSIAVNEMAVHDLRQDEESYHIKNAESLLSVSCQFRSLQRQAGPVPFPDFDKK